MLFYLGCGEQADGQYKVIILAAVFRGHHAGAYVAVHLKCHVFVIQYLQHVAEILGVKGDVKVVAHTVDGDDLPAVAYLAVGGDGDLLEDDGGAAAGDNKNANTAAADGEEGEIPASKR